MFVTKWADLVKRRSASINLYSPRHHGEVKPKKVLTNDYPHIQFRATLRFSERDVALI